MTEQQQVAMIRTMLYFIGKNQLAPTTAAVLAQLRETGSAAAIGSGWDVVKNAAPGTVAGSGWNLTSNKAK